MEDNLQITPEQIAYLNENLDLVNEYAEIHWRDVYDTFRGQGDLIVRITCGLNMLKSSTTPGSTYIILVVGKSWVAKDWEPLLKYVENNSNIPPILK